MDLQEQKEITRKNLERVLTELPKLVKKHPYIRNDFDMDVFGVYEGLKKENLNQCNTVGCLLGNSARVFVDGFTNDLFNKYAGFDSVLFGRKYFPYLYEGFGYSKLGYVYLFAGRWSKTKFYKLKDALQRIKNLLANDLECDKYDYSTNKIIN